MVLIGVTQTIPTDIGYDQHKDKATEGAYCSVLKTGIHQTHYRLKQLYFNNIPADQIRTTSPVPFTTDEQWYKLVGKWSNAKNKVFFCLKVSFYIVLLNNGKANMSMSIVYNCSCPCAYLIFSLTLQINYFLLQFAVFYGLSVGRPCC